MQGSNPDGQTARGQTSARPPHALTSVLCLDSCNDEGVGGERDIKTPCSIGQRSAMSAKPSALHLWLCMYVCGAPWKQWLSAENENLRLFWHLKNDLEPNYFIQCDGDRRKALPIHRSHVPLFCSCPFLSPISKTDTSRRSRFDSHI